MYLGIAALQGLGRLDEAVFWLRKRKRLAAEIIDYEFGEYARLLDPAYLIFDHFWSSHIGHTALLGVYVKRNLLEGKPVRRMALVRGGSQGNTYLVNQWKDHFCIVDQPSELPSPFLYSAISSKNLFLEDSIAGPDTYFWQAYSEISRAWEAAGGGSLLKLSQADILRGREMLDAMGLPGGAWYVCLHVRSRGFKRLHEGLQASLNADIASYDLVIDAVVERGGWVIRMGDPSTPRLPAHDRVIDYAHNSMKADWLDIFLCATCRFYIGTSSGLAYVPSLFGTPCVLTNWFPSGTRPLNGTDLFLPKLHWYDAEGEFAPFADSLAPPLGHIHAASGLRALGVSLKDNTPEELRDVVVEMLDRLDGQGRYTAEDDLLAAHFDAVARSCRSFGNARIGKNFIRKYRNLLPACAPSFPTH